MIKANNETPIDGMLVMKNMDMKLLDSKTVSEELNLEEHQLRFTSSVKIESSESIDEFFSNLKIDLDECFAENSIEKLTDTSLAVDSVLLKLHNSSLKESKKGTTVKDLLISWRFEDESLGSRVLDFLTPSSEPGEFDKEF